MADDIDGRPETLDAATLKNMVLQARDRARKAVGELPSGGVMEFELGEQYCSQDLVDALEAIPQACEEAQRLYTIACAKHAREKAREIIVSKTQLIDALESSGE